MLIDLHGHTKGISKCCKVYAPDVLAAAKAVGLDGICLCNHYQRSYVENGDALAFAQRYVDEFRYTRDIGKEMGLTVLFGLEVSMRCCGGDHFLIYGVDETFPLEHPPLYDMPQKELYDLVHSVGGIAIQAHPLRMGRKVLLDLEYSDGVEVNCHPLYDGTHVEEMTALAKSRGMILTCGADYHADTPRVQCGVYLPDDITTGVQLGQYLKNADVLRLRVQEVGEQTAYDMEYHRYA